MSNWVPESFARLVDATRRGERPRVSVSELVGWFGFTRRGVQVNGYVRDAMRDAGVLCEPPFEKAFHDDELTFTTVTPIVILAPPPTAPARELPHPVALFDAVITAQSNVTRRVSTRLEAIERLVALLVFALIALRRNAPGTRGVEELRQIIDKHLPKAGATGAPVSFGSWVDLARRLSALRLDPDDPIAEAARRVFSPTPGGEALGEVLSSTVVRARNHLHHASIVPASVWHEADAMLVEIASALRQALAPLFAAEMVSVHRTTVREREASRYALRVLHGDGPYFRTRELETSALLTSRWAYLLREGHQPLRLAPGVFCLEDEATEAVSVYLCRTLALDPGQRVSLLALVGGAERKETLPT